MNKLPLEYEYHIEIYENSFINDPSIAWSTTTPSQNLSTGDYFEHRHFDCWYEKPKQGERFIVKEIEHIFWEIENIHIGHKLMVCLEVVVNEKA